MSRSSFDEFSPCGGFRYVMGHIWSTGPRLASVALNPSVGSKKKNDPTNTRLERRALKMGLAGVVYLNLFPMVATNPRDMKTSSNPYGDRERADSVLLEHCIDNYVLCGWGVHGKHKGRGEEVRTILTSFGLDLHALAINADGSPKHPLYVGYDVEPSKWDLE